MENESYLHPSELAAALRLTKPTIIQWLNRGWIIHKRLPNGRRLIPESELGRLMSVDPQPAETTVTEGAA